MNSTSVDLEHAFFLGSLQSHAGTRRAPLGYGSCEQHRDYQEHRIVIHPGRRGAGGRDVGTFLDLHIPISTPAGHRTKRLRKTWFHAVPGYATKTDSQSQARGNVRKNDCPADAVVPPG